MAAPKSLQSIPVHLRPGQLILGVAQVLDLLLQGLVGIEDRSQGLVLDDQGGGHAAD